MGKFRRRGGREGGQTLIIFTIAMPLFLAIAALVIDGSMLMVHRRSLQVAADATALAVAQDLPSPCTPQPGCRDALASDYSQKNGGPGGLVSCNNDSSKANCYQTPYRGNNNLVEVRLTKGSSGLFASAVGLKNLFHVSARAVASPSPELAVSPVPGTTVPGTTYVVTTPGGTHTVTDPSTISGGSGIGFAMSRACNAIIYGGNPKGQVTGAFATNGGLEFQGSGNPKHVFWLGFDRTRCPNNPPSPPSGTNQCTAIAWGDASDSQNLCAKTLVNLNQNGTLPITWPVTPPSPPTPTALGGGNPYPPSWYPSKCIDLGNASLTFTKGSAQDHGPGMYCISGATTTLQLDNLNLSAGDGYTFFALGGAKAGVGSNGSTLKFYWPTACGPGTRPTTRASSYPCPGLGQTISAYDPFTLLYVTYPSTDGVTCAICLNGGNNNLTGDMFATSPNSFPPSLGPPPQVGGLVAISGGGLAAGSGFIESWNLSLSGNTGSYTGTGGGIPIPGGTHTTTDPDTLSTVVSTGTTIPGTVTVTTVGTNFNLDE